jgi:hypothetical protein
MKPHRDSSARLDFGAPAIYRITIQGSLDSDWSARLAGMKITMHSDGSENNERTVLQGRISDQAQLNGVLDTLYGLHLPILNVDRI